MMRTGVLAAIEFAQANVAQAESNLRGARNERDALVRQARAEGITLRAIGETAGLHYTQIRNIEKGAAR